LTEPDAAIRDAAKRACVADAALLQILTAIGCDSWSRFFSQNATFERMDATG